MLRILHGTNYDFIKYWKTAAVGTIAGRTVVHHQADYWAFTPVAMPGGGVALMVSRTRWDR